MVLGLGMPPTAVAPHGMGLHFPDHGAPIAEVLAVVLAVSLDLEPVAAVVVVAVLAVALVAVHVLVLELPLVRIVSHLAVQPVAYVPLVVVAVVEPPVCFDVLAGLACEAVVPGSQILVAAVAGNAGR